MCAKKLRLELRIRIRLCCCSDPVNCRGSGRDPAYSRGSDPDQVNSLGSNLVYSRWLDTDQIFARVESGSGFLLLGPELNQTFCGLNPDSVDSSVGSGLFSRVRSGSG